MDTPIYSRLDERRRCVVNNNKPSRTQQHFARECNINVIMAKARKTGMAPVNSGMPQYLDCTVAALGNYHEAQNKIVAAQQSFAQLPAALRAKFGNNPDNLIEFLANEDNREMAEKLGLINPKPTNSTNSTNEVNNAVNSSSSENGNRDTTPAGAGSGTAPQTAQK